MSPKEIHPSVKISVACSCRAAFGVDLVSFNANLSLFGLKFWCEVRAKNCHGCDSTSCLAVV